MVKIVSDSTCDLSPELVNRYDIDILPLHILLGEKEYKDGKNITPDEIFAWSDAHKTTPKTSAPSLVDAIEILKPYVEEKREVICFSISSSMSTSGNVMRLAADELEASDFVTVIDSANLSTGIGLQVVEAAVMAQAGKSAAEITAALEEVRPKVRASFVVDTLMYLYRGGRCNAVAAMAGSVLKLHPKIVVENGAMDAAKKYRGKLHSVVMSEIWRQTLKMHDRSECLLHIPAVTVRLWKMCRLICRVLEFFRKFLRRAPVVWFQAIVGRELWEYCLLRNKKSG